MESKNNKFETLKAADLVKDLPNIVNTMDSLRAGSNQRPSMDITLEQYVQSSYNVSQSEYLKKLGIDTSISTMQNIFSMPNTAYRWVVPEIIRTAIRLGIDQAPIHPSLISADQPIKGLSAIMPYINPSDATVSKVDEGETIPLGTVSYGQKSVNLFKLGKGFKLTDEVRNFVSLDVLGIYISDFGRQLGYSLDNMAMDVLLNGNKADGSESAPVIGVKTPGTIIYRDLLKLWVRAGRIGRNFQSLIGGEDMAIDLLDLPEFKDRKSGSTEAQLTIKSPVPNRADFFIHGGIPDSQVLLVDPRSAMIKLTAQQLTLESERIVSNQTSAIYSTLTTGFSKMYQDSAILIDSSVQFNKFPDLLDIDPFLDYNMEH